MRLCDRLLVSQPFLELSGLDAAAPDRRVIPLTSWPQKSRPRWEGNPRDLLLSLQQSVIQNNILQDWHLLTCGISLWLMVLPVAL